MPSWFVRGFALLICAFRLGAQHVAITGTVVDSETGVPVAGATVVLRYTTSPSPVDTVVSGVPGTFEFSLKGPGYYAVAASAPGYTETVSSTDVRSDISFRDADFEAGAADVTHKVELKLPRSGVLSGVVVDGDSRKPLPLVPVHALRLHWVSGRRLAEEEKVVLTDSQGVFRVEPLPAGEYAVLLGNTSVSVGGLSKTAERPMAYPLLVRPEGTASDFLPFTVGYGEMHVGTIEYSKMAVPRIDVDSECRQKGLSDEKARTEVWVDRNIGGAWYRLSSGQGSMCGPLSQIPVLSRGLYRLVFVSHPNEGLPEVGEEEIEMRDGDEQRVRVRLFPMAPVAEKVTCECEKPFSPESVRVHVQPFNGQNGMSATGPPGSADMAAIAGDATIYVGHIPLGLFVKRLLFNGVEAGRMVSMNLGSPVSGEVVLSDKPAVIQGSVENDGKPFLNGHVVAVKWPVPAGVDYVDFASADVDGNGGFRIGDLASGTYRAVAVGPELWARREMPREVAGWVVGADSISVGEGESKAVRVTVKGQ